MASACNSLVIGHNDAAAMQKVISLGAVKQESQHAGQAQIVGGLTARASCACAATVSGTQCIQHRIHFLIDGQETLDKVRLTRA